MLSDEQRKLVEDNMKLIFLILHKLHLPLELQDIGYLGLCKAALHYKSDSGYSFSTFACKCIYNQFLYETRKQHNRDEKFSTVSLDQTIYSNDSNDSNDSDEIKLKDTIMDTNSHRQRIMDEILTNYFTFIKTLPYKQKVVAIDFVMGIQQRKTAEKLECSQAQVARIIKKINEEFINKYYEGFTLYELLEEE